MKNQQPAGEGAHSFKKVSRTAGPEGPRDSATASEPKKQRMKAQEQSRKPMGAHETGKGANDHVSRPGVHNGRQIPAPTKSSDLFREVSNLAPGGKKAKRHEVK
jgi:hypothetical protein